MDYTTPLRTEDITEWHKQAFLVKVKVVNECHEWFGCKNKQGYGVVTINSKQYIVTRIAYFIHYGIDPHPNCVLHTCDNMACTRKEHIYLGTRAKNTEDRIARHRGNCCRGEQASNSIFTENQVREIRHRVANGESMYSIAKLCNVSFSCISLIVRRKRWAHID